MNSRRQARVSLAAVVVALVGVTACSPPPADRGPASSDGGQTSPSGRKPCVVAAAGDVAAEEDYRTGAARTAELISSVDPRRVLALGDLAYEDGTAAEFADYYDPTWGDFKAITAPTPGNHEYNSDGKGYFDYFDVAPNYAFDLCGWRIVSVDQYASMRKAAAFIADEGKAAGDTPLLVFWHEPRFSSGSEHGSDPEVQPLWEAAVKAGADIVLNGHDHNYERFEPMGVNGEPRPDGTVEFVSGNGGHSSKAIGRRQGRSAVAVAGTPGVLFLTLRPHGYDWSYRDVEGRAGDTGTRRFP
jgi:acid phosphatase type 7